MDLLTENYRGFSWCPYKNYATQTYNRHTNTQFGTMKILWCLKTSWDTENVTVDGSNIQHTYVPRHICVFSNLWNIGRILLQEKGVTNTRYTVIYSVQHNINK